MIIFDCNGVLADSEPIAASVLAQEFNRAGLWLTPDIIARYFTGRRLDDVFSDVEAATGWTFPADYRDYVSKVILQRLRAGLRPIRHVEHALTWLRGPKCVASSSSLERIEVILETTGLSRFFGSNLYSATTEVNGKPAPDLYLRVAHDARIEAADCVVVEDSPAGIAAATAAGMASIGFVGGSHAGLNLGAQLDAAGAHAVIADMRALKGTIVAIRGW